jgi:hypothetical protein
MFIVETVLKKQSQGLCLIQMALLISQGVCTFEILFYEDIRYTKF